MRNATPVAGQKLPLLSNIFRVTRSGFITVIVFSFFTNLLAFVGPLYMLQIYDRVITSRNETTLVLLSVIAIFLLVVFALLEKLRSSILVRLGLLFDNLARGDLFSAVLRGTLRQPNGGHTQALRDLDMLREFLTGTGLISFCDAPWVPIFIAAAFMLHPWYGWVSVAGALLLLILTILGEVLTRNELKKASRAANEAWNYAASTARNAEVLQAMGMAGGLKNRWLAKQSEVLNLQALASDRAGYLVAATKFVRASLQIAILGTGAYLSIIQESTPGAMIAASIIMGRALAPVELVVGNWKGLIAARSAYERIANLLGMLPPPDKRIQLPAPKGDLAVSQIVAAPPMSKDPVIRGVTFALSAGEILGVIGPSAAGKSSLARVIVGTWPIAAGTVRIDGSDLNHWDNEQLGPYIGYLPQDIELFSGTVAENIARFGDVDEVKIIEAARLAGVHEMVQLMPDGYNTQIGDGGAALSGGQRQRIGLARALYGHPVLVVLDEPNASLDADGEASLLNAIGLLKARGCTVVLITHKISLLRVVDKILLMQKGVGEAFGGRDEILAKLTAVRPVPVPQGPSTAAAAN